jgi:hypothetical protein
VFASLSSVYIFILCLDLHRLFTDAPAKVQPARKSATPIGVNLRESNLYSASHATTTRQKPELYQEVKQYMIALYSANAIQHSRCCSGLAWRFVFQWDSRQFWVRVVKGDDWPG